MIINQKYSHNLPQQVSANMAAYLVTPDFQKQVMQQYLVNTKRRFLTPVTPFGQIIVIQHSGWYTKATVPSYMMTLTSVAQMGLLDVMLLSHEGTHDTALLWLMSPRAHIYKSTENGVAVASSVPNQKDPVSTLSMTDGLSIMADKRVLSTVIINADAYGFETY